MTSSTDSTTKSPVDSSPGSGTVADRTWETVSSSGIIGIIRTSDPDLAHARATACLAAGLKVVEVSLVTPGALEVIAELAGAHAGSGVVVGAGTVLGVDDARAAISAGSRILVCPTFDAAVVRTAVEADVAVVPGCLTPTEMNAAQSAGATAVKIFPAELWSPSALAGLLAAMPHLRTVPTGGVGPGNAGDWFRAGARALGVGSALTASEDPGPALADLAAAAAMARRPTP